MRLWPSKWILKLEEENRKFKSLMTNSCTKVAENFILCLVSKKYDVCFYSVTYNGSNINLRSHSFNLFPQTIAIMISKHGLLHTNDTLFLVIKVLCYMLQHGHYAKILIYIIFNRSLEYGNITL